MTMKENERYKRHTIYSNRDAKKDSSDLEKTHLKSRHTEIGSFLVTGKPDFDDSNFYMYNWERINKPSLKEKEFMENTPGYKDYKETILYKGPQGRAIVHANYRKDKHKINIYLNNADENHHKMDAVKFMFQSEWGLILEEVKDENSDLIKKIESN